MRDTPGRPSRGPGEMIATGDLERVTPNRRYELELLNLAGEKIAAAQQILKISPSLALTAAYDAARHCVDAYLDAEGLRAKSGEGSHRVRVEYAQVELSDVVSEDLLRDYAAARQIRHEAEYPAPNRPVGIQQPDALRTIDLAKAFHTAVTAQMKRGAP